MKTASIRLLGIAVAGLCLMVRAAMGTCAGDTEVAGEWIFEPLDDSPGWAVNSGTDGDEGNLGLTGGALFSTNVPEVNGTCAHSLSLSATNAMAGAVSINDYDPLAGADKFSILAWVRRDGVAGSNLSARIFSDADSTSLTNTTKGVEFRFAGNSGTLALRINGTEVGTSVGGISPTNGEWHHVAVVYDGTRTAATHATRNVHFYVDGVQRGNGGILQNAVVASNSAPAVAGNASPSRTAANLLAGQMDDLLVIPGWAPNASGNGNVNESIRCFMERSDDIFPPTLVVPPDVVTNAEEFLLPVAVELGQAMATDDCEVASVRNNAPTVFPVGTNFVTWTATDTAGNTTTKDQKVIVYPSREHDSDGDGLNDYDEVMVWKTNPLVDDTDGDGLTDGEEVLLHGTSPLKPDTDDDGLPDNWEVDNTIDPLDDGTRNENNGPNGDPDGDGFPNLLEYELGGFALYSAWSDRQLAYRLCHLQNGTNQPGLRVEVEDSANCGGTNDERQNVTADLSVPDLMSWGVFLDITVEGLVEDQNAGYDKVTLEAFTNTYFFEGNEKHHGCTMAAKSATCQVLVLPNSQVSLRYDTVGHMYHHGAYAEITGVTVAGHIQSEPLAGYPPNYWRTELGVGEEVALRISPDPGNVTWQIVGETSELVAGAETWCVARETTGSEQIKVSFSGHEISRTFQVYQPTGILAQIQSTNHYPVGYAGAGMVLDPVVVGPTNVSFCYVKYHVGGCAASNCTGYWATNAAPSFPGDEPGHWVLLPFDNRLPQEQLELSWDIPWSDLSMAAGHFEWEIPAKWKVGDTGTEHSFPGWVQEFDLDGDGTLSIGKFGRGVTRTTADEITIE